jgi:hypothetical protein
MKFYSFNKPTPTHKRVKSSILAKDPIVGIHNRFMSNQPSPLNGHPSQMDGVKGFSFTNPIGFSRRNNSRGDSNKTFTRNQSHKKYRENNSEISESYLKSFDSKRIKKKKIKKILPNSGMQSNF